MTIELEKYSDGNEMKENYNEYEDTLEIIAKLILSFPIKKQREILNRYATPKENIV